MLSILVHSEHWVICTLESCNVDICSNRGSIPTPSLPMGTIMLCISLSATEERRNFTGAEPQPELGLWSTKVCLTLQPPTTPHHEATLPSWELNQ